MEVVRGKRKNHKPTEARDKHPLCVEFWGRERRRCVEGGGESEADAA